MVATESHHYDLIDSGLGLGTDQCNHATVMPSEKPDDVVAYNRSMWDQQVAKGDRWTVPFGRS